MIETVVMLVHMYNVLALIIPWGVAKKNGTDPTPKIPAMIFALISTIAMMVALSPASWLFYAVLASTIAITLWINRDAHNWVDRQLIMKDFYQLQESIAKYVEDDEYLPVSLRFLDLYYDIQHGDNSTDQLDKKIRNLKVLWLDRRMFEIRNPPARKNIGYFFKHWMY